MSEEILYEVESHGTKIQVIDKKKVRHLRFGNGARQSSIDKENPYKLQTKYARDIVKVFNYYKKEPHRVLVLGLGAGTIPSYLFHKFPNTLIDIVELLPELKDVASDYFAMPKDERLNIIIEDGYDYIMNTKHVYDVIFMDIFNYKCGKAVKICHIKSTIRKFSLCRVRAF